jgi:AcrR family transcriptional regulator
VSLDSALSLRDRKKRRSRDQIYEAAIELFCRRPYGAVTVEEICERAEVGRATFFRFYGSKAGLLVEFNDRIGERLRERLEAMADRPAIERLWAVQDEIGMAWGSSSLATREMAREWIRTSPAAELTKRGRTSMLVALVAVIVGDGQRSGELTDRFSATFVAGMIVSLLQATIAAWLGGGAGGPGGDTRDVLEFLLDGMRCQTNE